jgi:hypothetical protein
VKGVSFFPQTCKWHAQIYVNGRNKNLGYFTRLEDAKAVYDREAAIYFGEFARAG